MTIEAVPVESKRLRHKAQEFIPTPGTAKGILAAMLARQAVQDAADPAGAINRAQRRAAEVEELAASWRAQKTAETAKRSAQYRRRTAASPKPDSETGNLLMPLANEPDRTVRVSKAQYDRLVELGYAKRHWTRDADTGAIVCEWGVRVRRGTQHYDALYDVAALLLGLEAGQSYRMVDYDLTTAEAIQ